jgi:SOS-response transcriptional repressor LexA
MATATTPAQSGAVETASVASLTIRTRPRIFAVRVPDASFRPLALLPGDVVVCEHGIQPRHGDVVAALVDGASVLRVWSMQGGRPVLRSPDGQTPPERAEGLVIQGVGVQVVRSRGR